MQGVKSPGQVNIPNRGWYLFGGKSATLLRAQKMNTLTTMHFDNSGPNLYGENVDDNQCLVQVHSLLIFLNKILFVYFLFRVMLKYFILKTCPLFMAEFANL